MMEQDVYFKKLCSKIKRAMVLKQYPYCEEHLREAMKEYPDAPQPHNLYGIMMEKRGQHALAMKHLRAAWALDPTYQPARWNLEAFGTFSGIEAAAYDEHDLAKNEKKYGKPESEEMYPPVVGW